MKLVTLKSSGTLGSGGKPALDALKKAFEQTLSVTSWILPPLYRECWT